jgi:hypothetical protein
MSAESLVAIAVVPFQPLDRQLDANDPSAPIAVASARIRLIASSRA